MNNIKQILNFSIVGIINTIVDLGVFNLILLLFKDGALTEIQYLIAKSIAFSFAIILSYFLNANYVFNTKKNQKSILLFSIISVLSLFINVFSSLISFLILGKLIENVFIQKNIGALIGSATSAIWNFLGYKHLAFRKK